MKILPGEELEKQANKYVEEAQKYGPDILDFSQQVREKMSLKEYL